MIIIMIIIILMQNQKHLYLAPGCIGPNGPNVTLSAASIPEWSPSCRRSRVNVWGRYAAGCVLLSCFILIHFWRPEKASCPNP